MFVIASNHLFEHKQSYLHVKRYARDLYRGFGVSQRPWRSFGPVWLYLFDWAPFLPRCVAPVKPWADTISTVHGSKHCLFKKRCACLLLAELWFNCDVGSCDAQLCKYSLGLFWDMELTNETHVYAKKISQFMQAVSPVLPVEEAATSSINFNDKPIPFLTSDASPWNQTCVSQLQMMELNNDIWVPMFHQNLCEPTCGCFVSTRGNAALFTESSWALWTVKCWREF